jgi:HSP20 family protein
MTNSVSRLSAPFYSDWKLNNFEPIFDFELDFKKDLVSLPEVDLVEEETRFVYRFDLPGVKKEDVKIEIKNKEVLSVSGERKNVFKKGFFTEVKYGKFSRDILIHKDSDLEKISAILVDGVLTLTIEKKEIKKKLKEPEENIKTVPVE